MTNFIQFMMVMMDELSEVTDSDMRGRIADIFVNFLALNGKFARSIMQRTHMVGLEHVNEDYYRYSDIRTFDRICSIAKCNNHFENSFYFELYTCTPRLENSEALFSRHKTFEEAEAEVFKYLRSHMYTYVGDIDQAD